ncbi:hypothetical protein GGF32_008483 [Allomyces javanicus]|nr:hypothetical protein GGF32_008483 [Allomyces javanicus]
MSTAAAATGSAGHVSTMAAVGLAVAAGAAALYSIIALEKPLRPQPPMARRRRGGRAGVRAMRREHEERQRQQQELEEKQQQQQLDGGNDDDARRLPSPAPSDIAEPDDNADATAAVNRARTPSPVSAAPVHLSQLDADSLDSELAKTDAKLRRLLVRKERLELRRTQLSVTAMHRPPSTTGPAATATDMIDHADADPAHNDEDIAWGHAPVSLATTTASPLSPSPTDTSLASPRPYESTVPRRARRVSHTSSTDSANGSALSTSPTAPAVFPSHSSDSSESGGNEVDAMAQLQQDLEDDRDDVLSALSDDSDLASSFISDLSLGSDFSLLSEARYGRPAA